MSQYIRDGRIAMIDESAKGVTWPDIVDRRLLQHGGTAMRGGSSRW